MKDADLDGKVIFLRLDWNVPLKDDEIINDNRIRATLPTIEYLISRGCKIIIGTHLGRPEGEVVESLSTRILAKQLSKYIKSKIISTDLVIESRVKEAITDLRPGDVLVLGNLRWYSEEETNNMAFAHILASYADIYINDAFSVCHRAHASVEAITNFLPSYAGLQLEKEVVTLKLLTKNPRKPVVIILGGAKIKDKMGLIKEFANSADEILIGGAISNTIAYFKGKNISGSFFEPSVESSVEEICRLLNNKLILPVDSIKKELDNGKFSILDIGPETIRKFSEIIATAKTIFWNGNLGYTENKDYQNGSLEIAKAIIKNPYTKIVAGGDTVGFLETREMLKGFTFASTGGGASLEFLAGKELPGLKALSYYEKK